MLKNYRFFSRFLALKIIVFFSRFSSFFARFFENHLENVGIFVFQIIRNPFKIHYFHLCGVPRCSKNFRLRRAFDWRVFYNDPFKHLAEKKSEHFFKKMWTFFSSFFSRFFT